ncbi:MAG TPA: alpha/beta hydrolase-fold protein [Lysobacter sp.]
MTVGQAVESDVTRRALRRVPASMAQRLALMLAGVTALLLAFPSPAASAESRLVTAQIASTSFANSRIGIHPLRKATVYLPPGYADSRRRFPVVYFLSNFFEDQTAPFASNDAKGVFDAAIAAGVIGDVIVVTADFSTPTGTSWFVNSAATGNWEDFMVRELVPYIDQHYRTMPRSASRGIAGDRAGGHGAIRFGMRHPDVFGAVYALHPIGVGQGVQTMFSRPDWALLERAASPDDLRADGYSLVFTSVFQAFLPDPGRPPLFFSPPARRVGDRLEVDAALTERLQDGFFLDRQVADHASNLKRLRGMKFDWARGDTVADHIVSLQAFTRTLDEYAIPYEAEEYRGGWGERNWGLDGRVYTDMLPFFQTKLLFE